MASPDRDRRGWPECGDASRMKNATDLYAHYQARLHALIASAEDEEFRAALSKVASDLGADLRTLGGGDRKLLCDELGMQIENELYRATDARQRRALVALLKDHGISL